MDIKALITESRVVLLTALDNRGRKC